jgi:hypothetical protein
VEVAGSAETYDPSGKLRSVTLHNTIISMLTSAETSNRCAQYLTAWQTENQLDSQYSFDCNGYTALIHRILTDKLERMWDKEGTSYC